MNTIRDLIKTLVDKKLILATAESCTGGMISSSITDIEGVSAVFDRGFVTYSNQAKKELLSVSEDILERYGAVSAECAAAMVIGATKNSHANIAVSVTGIAGPDGGSAEKPVGLVYIGVCLRGHSPYVEECLFEGNRSNIRRASMNKALELVYDKALRAV